MYKLSWDFDKMDYVIVHPAIKAYQAGKKLTKVKVVSQFEDDHLPCVNVKVTIGGKVYNLADCWLTSQALGKWYQAEISKAAREAVFKRLLKYTKQMIRDHGEQMQFVAKLEAKKK